MKVLRIVPSTRRLTALIAPLLLGLTLVMVGCATRRQVAEIVAQSNAAMVAGQIGLPDARAGTNGAPWQEVSDRIETFIAAHPDQKAATAPLRVRQAMLLLSCRQFNLAEAAFNAADLGDLHTDRDKALKRNQATLLWWFAASTNDTWTATDQDRAQAALKNLKEEQAALAASPEIRDYLAEIRAWIGLAATRQTTSVDRARERFQDALEVYAGTLTPSDLEVLAAGREQLPDPKVLWADARRRLRARTVLEEARRINKDSRLEAHPKPVAFDHLVNR